MKRDNIDEIVNAIAPKAGVTKVQVPFTLAGMASNLLDRDDIRGSRLSCIEREIVVAAFTRAGGNVSAAARLVGIDRKSMERKVAKYKVKS